MREQPRMAQLATPVGFGQVAENKTMHLDHPSASYQRIPGRWPAEAAEEVQGGSSVEWLSR